MPHTVSPSTAPFARLAEQLGGSLVMQADPGWDVARQPWNLSTDQRPEAVALVADVADIQAVVIFAAEHNLRVVAQGTGHLASALEDLDGAILLRTEALNHVEVSPDADSVRVGAGVVWGQVTSVLASIGRMALAGSSPNVGLAGYLLGGGYSWFARKHGLALNYVTSIDVVTADGRALRLTKDDEPDLFWALRGGGGNFAIVTAFEFRIFATADVYAGALMFPLERAAEVFAAYEAWTKDLTEAATTCVRLLRLPPMPELPDSLRGKHFAAIDGAIDLPDDEAALLLAPLRALGPEIDTFGRKPVAELSMMHLDPPNPVPAVGTGAILHDLTPDAVDALMAVAGPDVETPLLLVDLRHLGGAVSRSDPAGGAVSHLSGRFLLFTVGIAPDAATAAAVGADVDRVLAAISPCTTELMYSNFVEAPADPREFYDQGTLERLRAIKRAYDPADVICATHPLH